MSTGRLLLAAGLIAVLGIQAASARSHRVHVSCFEGALATTSQVACDFDQTHDLQCTVALPCPLCVYQRLACLVACSNQPDVVATTVPVGKQRVLRLRSLKTTLVVRCRPSPRAR